MLLMSLIFGCIAVVAFLLDSEFCTAAGVLAIWFCLMSEACA